MKLKTILSTALFGLTFTGFAIEQPKKRAQKDLEESIKEKEIRVKMPKADVLRARLRKAGFDYFMEKTTIVEMLADKERYIEGVANTVAIAYLEFYEDQKKGWQYYKSEEEAKKEAMRALRLIQMNEPMLYKALLENEPEALRKLEALGLYEPIRPAGPEGSE